MFRYNAILYFAAAGILFTSRVTLAEEQMVPLAAGGDWIAMAHTTSMTAHPDVCLVANTATGLAVRADSDGVQVRVGNKSWALPTGVQGTISLTISDWKSSFDIDYNTNSMVSADVSTDAVSSMFAAMDKSSTMSIVVGKAKPVIVSLSGSTRATNAFRTCAGIAGTSKNSEANPFE